MHHVARQAVAVAVAIATFRRHRRRPPALVNDVSSKAQLVTDEATPISLIVAGAQAQLNSQLASDDALDLKALGVLGADAVAIGVLVAANAALPYWWIPAVVLGFAAIILLWVVWPVNLSEGPEWAVWYETFGGGSANDVARQMLADVTNATATNNAAATRKGSFFKIGCVVLLIGLVGAVVVALVR